MPYRRRYTRRYKKRGPRTYKKPAAGTLPYYNFMRRLKVGYSGRNKLAVHHFKRAYAGGINITATSAVTQFNAYTFNLGQVVNPGDFSNLYDQFRINKLVMKFRLINDPAGANAIYNQGARVPRLFWYLDYDDATTPANLNEMRERAKCKMKPLSAYKPVVIKWTPSVLVSGYESAVNTMYLPKFKQWIDMADIATQHFGIKFAIDQFDDILTPFSVEIETWFYFSCKNVR